VKREVIFLIYQDIEFHNVAEMESFLSGWVLQRFPKEVRRSMISGSSCATRACGCEIRFVTESPKVSITLLAQESEAELFVFKGDFFHSAHRLPAGAIRTITLEDPPAFRTVQPHLLEQARFSSKMWRIVAGDHPLTFLGLECHGYSHRPPMAQEKPRLRWLAYGSSITTGNGATHLQHGYVQQAAMRLRADVWNKGLPGACMCEREVADFLSERVEWEMVTLEIGVNMRSSVPPNEFAERVEYLIGRMTAIQPAKPVVVITGFPNFCTYEIKETVSGINERKYNEILRRIVKDADDPNLLLAEGTDILTEFGGLTADLIHPSDAGHALMGENLGNLLLSRLSSHK